MTILQFVQSQLSQRNLPHLYNDTTAKCFKILTVNRNNPWMRKKLKD